MDCNASGIMDRINYVGQRAALTRFCSLGLGKKKNDGADGCLFLRELTSVLAYIFNHGVVL